MVFVANRFGMTRFDSVFFTTLVTPHFMNTYIGLLKVALEVLLCYMTFFFLGIRFLSLVMHGYGFDYLSKHYRSHGYCWHFALKSLVQRLLRSSYEDPCVGTWLSHLKMAFVHSCSIGDLMCASNSPRSGMGLTRHSLTGDSSILAVLLPVAI